MSRLPLVAVAGAACAALALPAVASAEIIEVGKIDPAPVPSCPTRPCLAVSRTTGYQAKIGTQRNVMVIPQDGSLVAWSIGLGKPGKKQTAFFNDKLGGEAQAQLTVLNPRSKLRSRAVGQGDPQKLAPYFGTTVQFPLAKSIPVKKGWVIALTVPTWAPALAVGLGADTSWRASRGQGHVRGHLDQHGADAAQPARAVLLPLQDRAPGLLGHARHRAGPGSRPRPSAAGATGPGARCASRRRRAGSAGDRAGARSAPATARCARDARGTRPSAGGGDLGVPAKRCSTAATARSSSSREEMTSLCGDAHALMRAARGRPAK
jgi:hypothetical protein